MDNRYVGIRLVTNDVKGYLMQKKTENNVSNDLMCIILKEVLSDFTQAAAYDYAASIAELEAEKAILVEERNKSKVTEEEKT
ncbi:MAG: hypothetical protein K6E91_11150 [Butyrivibrio sp.]|nr:hypothetical protein [Butyrivibrio sp.]